MNAQTAIIHASGRCGDICRSLTAYREALQVARPDSQVVRHAITQFRRLAVELEGLAIGLQRGAIITHMDGE